MKFTGTFVSILALIISILSSLPGKVLSKTFQIKIEEEMITFGLMSEYLGLFRIILLIIGLLFLVIVFLIGIDRSYQKEYTFISILVSPFILSIGLVTMILITFSRQMILEDLIINIAMGVILLYTSILLSHWSLIAFKAYYSDKPLK